MSTYFYHKKIIRLWIGFCLRVLRICSAQYINEEQKHIKNSFELHQWLFHKHSWKKSFQTRIKFIRSQYSHWDKYFKTIKSMILKNKKIKLQSMHIWKYPARNTDFTKFPPVPPNKHISIMNTPLMCLDRDRQL